MQIFKLWESGETSQVGQENVLDTNKNPQKPSADIQDYLENSATASRRQLKINESNT